tara:strand:+ start:1989 stop:2603 length:615 start_codon:yes stop_codon:yes gene_type:complete
MNNKPKTTSQVNEIRWTIRQTQVTDKLRTNINNLYRQYINATADRCMSNGCGKLKRYQDELNRWFSTQNHKWEIEDELIVSTEESDQIKKEYEEGKGETPVKNAIKQVEDLKQVEPETYLSQEELSAIEITKEEPLFTISQEELDLPEPTPMLSHKELFELVKVNTTNNKRVIRIKRVENLIFVNGKKTASFVLEDDDTLTPIF